MSLREPFYKVREDAYLFWKQPELGTATQSKSDIGEQKRQQPEEEVRQWCAHELIRSYGIRIDEIEFERQVRVGSKKYRIDILVLRRGAPWAVIECKRRTDSKPKEGMEQAISYAGAEGVQAVFAVYTNGDLWHVRRRVGRQWLTVSDLPQREAAREGEPITEILRALSAAAPLLHKLNEPLVDKEANIFIGAMQSFLNGGNRLTNGVDPVLRFGADNLLRVLAGATLHEDYRLGKLAVACQSFEAYRKCIGLDRPVAQVNRDSSVAENCRYLNASLMCLLEGSEGIFGLDLLLLRLSAALSEYGIYQASAHSGYPALPQNVHSALRDLLDTAVATNLNAQLPDDLDRVVSCDLRRYCEFAWQQLERERHSSFLEVASWLPGFVGQWVRSIGTAFH